MGALSDLLKRGDGAATPATLATQSAVGVPSVVRVAESQVSQGGTPDLRAHLLSLADAEGYAPAIVHRLHGDDVTACADLTDAALRAYLRALDRGAVMDRGIAPAGYTQSVHCAGCGPVWLWAGAPEQVAACPWCFRRQADKALPRPQVTCGDCCHYLPDPLNPQAGIGGCALGAGRALWPMKPHRCAEHAPIDNSEKQRDSLLISQSVAACP